MRIGFVVSIVTSLLFSYNYQNAVHELECYFFETGVIWFSRPGRDLQGLRREFNTVPRTDSGRSCFNRAMISVDLKFASSHQKA